MPAQLRVLAGRDGGRLFPLPAGQPLLVGRDYATHTRLKDPQVAMLHCQVEDRAGSFVSVTQRAYSEMPTETTVPVAMPVAPHAAAARA